MRTHSKINVSYLLGQGLENYYLRLKQCGVQSQSLGFSKDVSTHTKRKNILFLNRMQQDMHGDGAWNSNYCVTK